MNIHTSRSATPAQVAHRIGRLSVESQPHRPVQAALIMRQVAQRYVLWTFSMAGDDLPTTMITGTVDVDRIPSHHRSASNTFCSAAVQVVPELMAYMTDFNIEVVDLAVVNPELRCMLRELGPALAPFNVLAGSLVNSRDPNVVVAIDRTVERFERAINAQEEAERRSTPDSIVIATDASLRVHHCNAAHAWVREDGHFHTASLETSDVLEAELAAIVHAICSHRYASIPVLIRSDSREAVRLASSALNGQVNASSIACKRLQRKVSVLRDGLPPITVEWVRGHSGDFMNELADRLALTHRRNHDAGIIGSENAARLGAIVGEELSRQPGGMNAA